MESPWNTPSGFHDHSIPLHMYSMVKISILSQFIYYSIASMISVLRIHSCSLNFLNSFHAPVFSWTVIFNIFNIFPSHNVVYCILCYSKILFINCNFSLRNIQLHALQPGRQTLHILQHNPWLYLNAKELKLKFITLKERQLHEHIMQ